MKELNLCLHAGGSKVEREAIYEAPTPQGTQSWAPIPHGALLDRVQETLSGSGFNIVAQAHALAREGARYFGLLQIVNGVTHDDYSLVVGIRNSHDKSFPAALCLGSGVFVCDNLAFSGEIKLARRHTRFIERDLPQVVARAVGLLGEHRDQQDRRILAYKGVEIAHTQAHDFIIRALDVGVVGPTAVPDVLKAWRSPPHEEFAPRTAWSLFNAFTEVLKGNAAQALKRTTALHGLMDAECKLVLAS